LSAVVYYTGWGEGGAPVRLRIIWDKCRRETSRL